MATSNSYNLLSDTIDTLTSNSINIIPFYDESTSNSYIQSDSSLTGYETLNSTTSDITLNALNQLINARDPI